ncbi:response regulator transcription factor [Alloyangia pacifica]|uniref:Two component transcriptional regulator, LuxR family n=1 Tax=Alloyangia pacifica TaxID=311180 RepID=A0A1I6VMB5_9RHOB|nr:response regulator transcription factor [Alloyangia pacifica]SDI05704.1 two component transcriptional regulator, LuxR family [Alloyangia pacifica]SFT14843.1 two component transcriptional regulator, LuxR family [Alloyangia pacifica]
MSMSNSQEPTLYIVDEMPLTRAQLSQFLSGFARLHRLRIEEVAASDSDDIFPQAQGGMCVINTGASSSQSIWFSIVQKLSQTTRLGPVVVFCEIASAEFVRGALEAGARGVVPAATDPAVALKSLDLTLHGGIFVPPSVLDQMRSSDSSQDPDDPPPGRPEQLPDLSGGSSGSQGAASRSAEALEPPRLDKRLSQERRDAGGDSEEPDLAELTPRQMAVLDHLSQARSNKEIARVLDTTEATVKLHVRQVMRKLGAKNRTEAALIAARSLQTHAGDATANALEHRPQTGAGALQPDLPSHRELLATVRHGDTHRIPSDTLAADRNVAFDQRAAEQLRRMEKSGSVHFSGLQPETGRLS